MMELRTVVLEANASHSRRHGVSGPVREISGRDDQLTWGFGVGDAAA